MLSPFILALQIESYDWFGALLNLIHSFIYLFIYILQAFHFDRDDVALKGFHEHFRRMSDTKRDYAMLLLKYQNERGGRIKLQNVPVNMA